MEFWGIEVKPGKPLNVQPEVGKLIHISQASLGEVKDVKGAKNVPLRLKVDGKSFIFGYLSAEGTTQLMVDLVFEKEFELSHDWKNGSVYFLGYTADEPDDDEGFPESDDESEDDRITLKENGNGKLAKGILAAAGKAKVKAGAKKQEYALVGSDMDDDDDDSSESDSDDEMALPGEADSGDEDDSLDDEDDSSSSDEELPKVQQSKKRPLETEKKSPASKKAKSVTTPEKSGKKGQTGTPTPAKAAGKTPKSAGQPISKSGNKNSAKAKHGRK